jgi:hypothetical protein
MSVTAGTPQGLRLPSRQVTVLLGTDSVRHAVLDALDAATARRPGGPACTAVTVTSHAGRTTDERVAALEQAAAHRPAIVLVARLTDGLDADGRRRVLAQLRTLAATGPAVLVDDADPVAALSVADGALRAGADGSLQPEALGAPANASVLRVA